LSYPQCGKENQQNKKLVFNILDKLFTFCGKVSLQNLIFLPYFRERNTHKVCYDLPREYRNNPGNLVFTPTQDMSFLK